MVKQLAYRLAGAVTYLLAVAPMVYFVGFLAGRGVPKGIDDGPIATPSLALALDLGLLLSFALVHSLLARPRYRARMLGWLPEGLDRAAYSVVAGAQMCAVMALWQPLPGWVWHLDPGAGSALLWMLFALGWAVVLISLPAIEHTHLFGIQSVWSVSLGHPYAEPPLVPRGPYRWIRHPLYLGTILAMWATPRMSAGHLLLAALFTIYILVGARLEERDLAVRLGETFLHYRRSVPAFLPRLGRRGRTA